MYAVILAGGGGTRLRPLSRADRPKPFLPLIDERTLIQRTVDRLAAVPGVSGVFVVVSPVYAGLVREQVPTVAVVVEPEGRNTAAAIARAALAIDRPDDEVMAVLPADHVIRDEPRFAAVLSAAADIAANGAFGVERPLVTLGIDVDRPATDYGYLIPILERGEEIGGLRAYPLEAFREKPDAAAAERLAGQPGVAWNAGMFLWQRGAVRAALEAYTPLVPALAPAISHPARLAAAYGDLRTRSIDYEVMEPAARDGVVVMASMTVGWTDIGGWTALITELGGRGTGRVAEAGEIVTLDSDDLLLRPTVHGLGLAGGPGTIALDAPSAVLTGVGTDRDLIEALMARVAAAEARAG